VNARDVLADATYVAVGFGLVAYQRAAVGVQELRRQLPSETTQRIDEALDTARKAAVDAATRVVAAATSR
jgi:hypothetical protein